MGSNYNVKVARWNNKMICFPPIKTFNYLTKQSINAMTHRSKTHKLSVGKPSMSAHSSLRGDCCWLLLLAVEL